MKRIILGLLLLAGVAQAQPSAIEANVVPACSPSNVNKCIGGAEPGRSAWVLDGGDGYFCVQNQAGQCVAVGGGGGDAGMFGFCAGGGKGVGFMPDAYGGTYAATCGNYPWSAESGGLTAGAADAAGYASATTPGGNTIELACTGLGVGTGQDGTVYNVATSLLGTLTAGAGSGASTFVKSGAANLPVTPVNALRGHSIRITVAGGGPTVGIRRLIISNTSSTITISGTWPAANPVNGATQAVVYDEIGGLCRAAGEVVHVNFMADAMLAQDHTRLGGTVYFPNVTTSATIYANRMCGRKGNVSTTTVFNNCPVLRAPHDDHFQRNVQRLGVRNWKWDGNDPNGETDGRTGAWIVADNGGMGGAPSPSFDNNDGTGTFNWPITNGPMGGKLRQCAMTGGKCIPANNTGDLGQPERRVAVTPWSRLFTLGNSGNQTTTTFCVDNLPANSGTCRDDRRVQCTTGANCTAAGLSTATCDSAWAAFDYEVNTLKHNPLVMVKFNGEAFPESGSSALNSEAGYSSISAVTATATGCNANNQNITFREWPALASRIRAGIGAVAFVLDETVWNMAGSVWDGGTYAPNNWYGQDNNLNAASDQGECFSPGFVDEPECDGAEGVTLLAAYEAKISNMTFANCSTTQNSCSDGAVEGVHAMMDTVTFDKPARGIISDISDVQFKDIIVRDGRNDLTTAFAFGFTPGTRSEGLFMYNMSALSLLRTNASKNSHLTKVVFESTRTPNSGFGAFDIRSGDGLMLSDIQFISHQGIGFSLYNGESTLGPIIINNVTATGRINLGAVGNFARAFINLSRLGNGDGSGNSIYDVSIDNVKVDTPSSNVCLAFFDDDTGGTAQPIDQARSKVRISNSGIVNTNSSTGAKALCMGNETSGVKDATSDTLGIFQAAERFVPSWSTIRVNSVPVPDQPFPQTQADNVNNGVFDCDVIPRGTIVHINNDITAANTCGDTDANHALEGGGTFRSLCKCGATGTPTTWVPF